MIKTRRCGTRPRDTTHTDPRVVIVVGVVGVVVARRRARKSVEYDGGESARERSELLPRNETRKNRFMRVSR